MDPQNGFVLDVLGTWFPIENWVFLQRVAHEVGHAYKMAYAIYLSPKYLRQLIQTRALLTPDNHLTWLVLKTAPCRKSGRSRMREHQQSSDLSKPSNLLITKIAETRHSWGVFRPQNLWVSQEEFEPQAHDAHFIYYGMLWVAMFFFQHDKWFTFTPVLTITSWPTVVPYPVLNWFWGHHLSMLHAKFRGCKPTTVIIYHFSFSLICYQKCH